MNNKIKKSVLGSIILLCGTLTFVGCSVNKKEEVTDFKSKFFGALNTEMEVKEDFLMGEINLDDKILKEEKVFDIYEEIGEDVPEELMEEYNSFLISNKELLFSSDKDLVEYTRKRIEKRRILSDKIKDVSSHYDIDDEQVEIKTEEYTKEYMKEIFN